MNRNIKSKSRLNTIYEQFHTLILEQKTNGKEYYKIAIFLTRTFH